MYTKSPISISEQKGSTVSFVVEQSWKDVGSVGAINVMYQSTVDRMQCSKNENVTEGSSVYNALCVNGVAQVAIFVSDDSFSGLIDISDKIPDSCADASLEFAMFMFSVPCDPSDENFCSEATLCPETSPSDLPLANQEGSSLVPSKAPSEATSASSSEFPSESPVEVVTDSPSEAPSKFPSGAPSESPDEGVSDSPSKASSEYLTELPSALPSREPSVSPDLDPVRTVNDAVCVQEAQMDGISVSQDGPFMYSSVPIRIVTQKGSAVTFTIENTWTTDDNGSLDIISVIFEGIDTAMVCSQNANIVDSTQELNALCIDGVADVVMFVTDTSFQGVAKITDRMPSSCATSADETVMFAFRIPCDPGDESFCDQTALCPDTGALDIASASLARCKQEARLDSDSTEKGKHGMYKSNPIMIADEQTTSVSFNVKQSWSTQDGSLDSLGVYYELPVEEKMVCNESTNFSQESPVYTAKCVDGVAEVALFVRDNSFQGHMDVSPTVPSTCSNALEPPAGEVVMFFFTIPCDQSDESFCPNSKTEGVDRSSRQIRDDEEDQINIKTNQITCGDVHEETFESPGDALSWEGGIESSSEAFGNFLGRFGSYNPEVQKVFKMPTEASSVTIRFKLYDINGGSTEDTLQLGIQNSWVDMNLTTEATQYHQDEAITLRDRAYDRTSFSTSRADNSYDIIEMVIPKRWWSNHNNELPFGFKVVTMNDINDDSYGIDDFTIVVDCGTQRRTKGISEDHPENESSEQGDGDSYYCKSADYPCGEGHDMVNICHYSTRQGYTTFCIPERDSEVLRFYSNDYCGPCANSFGENSDNWLS